MWLIKHLWDYTITLLSFRSTIWGLSPFTGGLSEICSSGRYSINSHFTGRAGIDICLFNLLVPVSSFLSRFLTHEARGSDNVYHSGEEG